jgi:diacylglycerol kinase family enzyme
MSRRAAAIVAVVGGVIAPALAAYLFAAEFPRGLVVFACILGALAAGWLALLRRGWRRLVASVLAALLIGITIGVALSGNSVWALPIVVVAFLTAIGGARVSFRPHRSLPPAEPPRHPVLFVNPWSGDGRAARAGLVGEAGKRGLETLQLEPGDDLEQLVRAAVGRGADGLAMAGGDGSQALVASIAAEHDLPYACIPSGTRNHFALDLGVDREDVVGALDAFADGGERQVDLGEVNGHVFVNNVSLGVYARAVNRERYREAKLRTLLETVAETLGPEGEADELRWVDPDGAVQTSTALMLVSNNPYLLGPTLGSGTRPRLDAGLLGIVDVHPPVPGEPQPAPRWRELTAQELEISSETPVSVGIDGEALVLEPPLRFRSRPRALRVRIAHNHPGASPSAEVPRSPLKAFRQLLRIAAGSAKSYVYSSGYCVVAA